MHVVTWKKEKLKQQERDVHSLHTPKTGYTENYMHEH